MPTARALCENCSRPFEIRPFPRQFRHADSSMKRAVFTIIAKNYLAHARALMASVKRFDPQVLRIVVLADEPEGLFDPAEEDFVVVSSDEIPVEKLHWFRFKYTVLEFSTAIKPFAARLLFDRYGFDSLAYLDPDILLYRSPAPIFEAVEAAEIVLTPHLTAQISDDSRPSEIDILRCGTYNLGFIGLRNSPECRRFLAWWSERVYDRCVVSLEHGLFVDQKWVDLAPGLFEGVKVIRDPSWNVAYWNLHARPITSEHGRYVVDGTPLLFFHFSGFDPDRPTAVSRHEDRFGSRDLGADLTEILRQYADALLNCGFQETRSWGYTWGRFHDGSLVPDVIRPVHHEDASIMERIADPFSEEGARAVWEIWNRDASTEAGWIRGMTRLAYRIYCLRPDVRAAMPNIFNLDSRRYQEWFVSSGRSEHGLSGAATLPVERALVEAVAVDLANDEAMRLASSQTAPAPGTLPIAAVSLGAAAIAESRPDVLARVSVGGKPSLGRFYGWLLTYGAAEHHLNRATVGVFQDEYRRWREAAGFLERLDAAVWKLLLQASLGFRGERPAETGTAKPVSEQAPASEVPECETPAPEAPGPKRPTPSAKRPFGVNLVGYVRGDMGVGEAVRLAAEALDRAHVPRSVHRVGLSGTHGETNRTLSEDLEHPFFCNLIYINADEFANFFRHAGDDLRVGRKTVGFWHWELENFPEEFAAAFEYCDEVWTPSRFCAEAIGRRADVPVHTIPHAVRPITPNGMTRRDFGLREDRFMFLTIADLLSTAERKNPLGAVRAFRQAFGNSEDVQLVVKISHDDADPAAMRSIQEAAASNVRIIAETMTRSDVDDLMNSCDCFVSLHRSEGFGLCMVEAMSLGKPVIATAYSGNVDFMDDSCAFLVDFTPGEVRTVGGPYRQGAMWAEPDLASASEQMRLVRFNSSLRTAVAAKGAARVRDQLSPARIGAQMKVRLTALYGLGEA